MVSTTDSRKLKELASLFLRLGATSFGGPAAHIAMMEEEVVRRRGWLDREKFLDLLAATNLIPGPNSTEMAIHVGLRRAGLPGLLVAGICFILPAFFLVLTLSWMYVRWGALPEAAAVLYGVKPVVIAVVLQALVGLTRTALKTKLLAAIGLAAAVANVLGVSEIAVLFGAGFLTGSLSFLPGFAGFLPLLVPTIQSAAAPAVSLAALGLFFLKVGSILFGSGYVLLAFLRADLVDRWGWLTESELLDSIAVGQMTPGPLFTAATFIGYVLAGWAGAIVATLGIFLPAFFFVAVSGAVVPRIRRSPAAGAFLDGVVVASLAIMGVVTVELARSALVDAPSIVLAILSAVLLLLFRVSSAWIVPGGAVAGLLLQAFGHVIG
jgi:chromate transporter